MKLSLLAPLFLVLTLVALAAGTERAKADAIGINLGAPGPAPYEFDVPFTNLNGTAVSGQMLSLEFVFTNWPYQEWLTVSNQMHGVLLMMQTDYVGGFIDSDLPGTAYLLDISGAPISPPMVLYYPGGWDNGGELFASVYSGAMMGQPDPLTLPFSYYGIHFDFSMPVMADTTVTGAQLRIVFADIVGMGFSGPNDQTLFAGSDAVFRVTGRVSEPIFYQWQFMGTNLVDSSTISGSQTAALILSNVQSVAEGSYTVVISDAGGTTRATFAAELAVTLSGQTAFFVTNTADSGSGSLRQALKKANLVGTGNISFPSVAGTTFLLSPLPAITANVTIMGLGPSSNVISGSGLFRVFDFTVGATCVLSGLTIRDGQNCFGDCPDNGSGGGIRNRGDLIIRNCEIITNGSWRFHGHGGGIASEGTLMLDGVTVAENRCWGFGGGVYSTGSLLISNCEFLANWARDNGGGGIASFGTLGASDSTMRGNYAYPGSGAGGIYGEGDVILTNCTITGNSSDTSAGGLYFRGNNLTVLSSAITDNFPFYSYGGVVAQGTNIFIANSSIVGNSGYMGGAMFLGGSDTVTTISNCTISGNGSSYSIINDGALNLINCTVSHNGYEGSRSATPSIRNNGMISTLHCTIAFNEAGVTNSGTFYAQNTILANNGTNLDFYGVLTSQGFNLIGNLANTTVVGDTTGNIYGADPLLGPLQDNGGPTWTHALLPGSPAIDAGSSGGLTTDQRGVPRPYDVAYVPNAGDGSDIGAYEWTPSQDSISQAVQRLMSEVSRSWLPNARPLTATLRAALASVSRGESIPAANQLHAFQNKVTAQSLASDPVVAQTLIQDAQAAIDAIRCDGFAPKVHSLKRHPDGKVQLNFSALTLQAPIVEASTNLVDWEVIGVGLNQGNGSFEFEDVNAAKFPHRFYRLVLP